jgi:hypothetical protein
MQNYFGCHISCGYSARTQIRDTYTPTEWVFVHEIPSGACNRHCHVFEKLKGFKTLEKFLL